MIKAIVVDDERLVRKGFISLIDWPSFGVVIVGEAGDGNAALALLREQEVDLLFVDISMPGMSGFDLIRQVRQRFPAIRCVVLTCHHEFDYVQEALRLGAVDYIVKTLLEVENADETIRRLVERIKWEDSTRESLGRGEGKALTADKALLYLPLQADCHEQELFQLPLVKNQPLIALREQWLSPLHQRFSEAELQRELGPALDGRWQIALVSGLCGRTLQELEEVFAKAARTALFYSCGTEELARLEYAELRQAAACLTGSGAMDSGAGAVAGSRTGSGANAGASLGVSARAGTSTNAGADAGVNASIGASAVTRPGSGAGTAAKNRAAAGSALFETALNLRWTIERGEWEELTATVLRIQPAPEAVSTFGLTLLESWSTLLLTPAEAAELEVAAAGNVNWCRWKQWLRQFAAAVQRRMIELGLSKEVMFCLIRAVHYMKQHAGEKINQGDVAAHINMSRGYFSQCFARFAGESFGEVLRGMRLELAKSLLLETNYPVQEIACRSGFEDDRYFSRLFREKIGRLPSDYRAEGMKP